MTRRTPTDIPVIRENSVLAHVIEQRDNWRTACEQTRDAAKEALIRCAEAAGVDGEAVAAARSGALQMPVETWALMAVQQLMRDYEDAS